MTIDLQGNSLRAALWLVMKAGLISVGLSALPLAMRLEGWQALLAALFAAAFVASAFLGLPARIVEYVEERRGIAYQTFFSIFTPLFLTGLSTWAAWRDLEITAILGEWPWPGLAEAAPYAVAAILNCAALLVNLRALLRRRSP